MISPDRTILILLAAGRSERFGGVDKLEQPYLGEPLAFHVVTALDDVPFCKRLAIVSGTRVDFASRGFTVIRNDAPAEGQGRSIRLAMEAARAENPVAVLLAFADMPRVTATHVYRMLDYADGADTILASSDGENPRPPALFGRNHFDALTDLSGDIGARDMILKAHHVIAAAHELIDIDTPEDLERLRAMV